jgi:mevalonate kinase
VTSASAPGKVILFGEHAVVYGRPAIAVPVSDVQATARVAPGPAGRGLRLVAHNIGRDYPLAGAPEGDALAAIVRRVLAELGVRPAPDLVVTLDSTIPIASGLGSGAACSAAIARALVAHLRPGQPLADERLNELVFAVEQIHHGTPSGIDNSVIVFGRPVYFRRGQPIETFAVRAPFWLAIGDTGVSSPTRVTVGDVRQAWQAEPARYEALFDRIGALADEARRAIEAGEPAALGSLMRENHELLRALGVSSPKLEALVAAASAAGAAGAKLSGGGRGGNMIALVAETRREAVAAALRRAGARGVIVTRVA